MAVAAPKKSAYMEPVSKVGMTYYRISLYAASVCGRTSFSICFLVWSFATVSS